jgi:hypothetical protein
VNAVIYNASNTSSTATDCGKSTQKCRFSTPTVSLQGTYTGNLHAPAVSDTLSLTSAGNLNTVQFGCSAPFTTYSGGTVTGTSIQAHVTSVT